jgi:HlyD family secretion protein
MFTIVNDLTQMEVQTSVDEADIGQVIQGQRVEFTVDAYPDLKFEGTVSQVRLQPVTTNNVVTYVVILNAPNPDKKLMPGMTASATIYIQEKQNTLVLSGKALRFTPDTEYLTKMMAKSFGNANSMPAGMPPTGSMPGTEEGAKTVWVKDEKSGIRPVPVTIGIENGSNVEILSGLKDGDEVIISMTNEVKKATTRTNAGPGGPMPF